MRALGFTKPACRTGIDVTESHFKRPLALFPQMRLARTRAAGFTSKSTPKIVKNSFGLFLTTNAKQVKLIEIESQHRNLLPDWKHSRVPTSTLLPLEQLGPGEWGDVEHVEGEPSWVGRMAELGLRAGSRLRVLRPGSPCLLDVAGCRLILRGDSLMRIFVRPVAVAS
jgi:ferrous iron transport protein A